MELFEFSSPIGYIHKHGQEASLAATSNVNTRMSVKKNEIWNDRTVIQCAPLTLDDNVPIMANYKTSLTADSGQRKACITHRTACHGSINLQTNHDILHRL
ncbi:hypothetical protein ACJX0J_035453 [Zea mays]